MSLNKKALAAAIVGALVAGNAAAADLTANPVVPDKYATEIRNNVTVTGVDATAKLNYNFSNGEVRYVRFSCNNVLITAMPTAPAINPNVSGSTYSLGALNGAGTNTVFFSITATTVVGATANDVVNFANFSVRFQNKNDVTCETALYDLPSQAQAGGAAGLVINSGTKGYKTLITRPSGFVFLGDDGTATADVESAPGGAYTEFVGNTTVGFPGNLNFSAAAGVLNTLSNAIALDDIFTTDTTVNIAGDYSAAAIAGWQVVADEPTPWSQAATELVYNYGGASLPLAGRNSQLVYVADGVKPIQASEYNATLNGDAEADYEVTTVTTKVGKIVRNGTELQAPLAQIPAGWLSRIVLTNTGTAARAYTLTVFGETGNTIVTNAAGLTGTVPAKGTTVIDLPTNVFTSFTGSPRATVIANVNAPNGQIQGLYQIVNPEKGSISNHVMVRPGTN